MKTYLTCPVCDRPKIEGDICPNCETDLSLIRKLTELPSAPVATPVPPKSPAIASWVPIGVAILILLLGIGLGAAGNSFYVQQQNAAVATISPPIETSAQSAEIAEPLSVIKNSPTCSGFYYTVRRGDYLSAIAKQFYGDGNLWPQIISANPQLQGRENSLEIGERFIVPNLEENCP
jgi:nucleoid-associated protein YgaU